MIYQKSLREDGSVKSMLRIYEVGHAVDAAEYTRRRLLSIVSTTTEPSPCIWSIPDCEDAPLLVFASSIGSRQGTTQ